jgi:hypothetical protein
MQPIHDSFPVFLSFGSTKRDLGHKSLRIQLAFYCAFGAFLKADLVGSGPPENDDGSSLEWAAGLISESSSSSNATSTTMSPSPSLSIIMTSYTRFRYGIRTARTRSVFLFHCCLVDQSRGKGYGRISIVPSCHPLLSISHGQERPAVGLCHDRSPHSCTTEHHLGCDSCQTSLLGALPCRANCSFGLDA